MARPRKRTSKEGIKTDVHGGVVQGVIGAQSVVIENLSFYGALPGQPPQDIDEGTIPPCPYPGLAYFGPQDSRLFFGRDAAIARLEAAVTKQALTALVGASGSGKSSVVLAGLAPRLADLAPRLNVQRSWRFSHFRVGTEPNKNPFLALARALVPLLGEHSPTDAIEEVQKLAAKLETGTVDLLNVMGACRTSNPSKRILLIADQFEEMFTLVNDEVLRHRFIDVLLAGFSERGGSDPPAICVVLTLRADFYGMALRHRPLADALQGRVENLGPMTREELREAIVRPAGTVTFENGLVDTLLDDVGSRPGSLPLLQFALREMWGRLDKRRMTCATYQAIGGVEGALAQRAQAIFESLTTDSKDAHAVMLFRRLFTRLVSLSEGAEDTRRIVGREELGQEEWALAQRLAGEGNRLIVTSAPAPGHETAEVVHEALIRNWPTFIEWVDRDRTFQSWLRQLKSRVDEWRKHPEDDGTLLRGGPLRAAEEWLQRRGEEVSEDERNYIDRSLKHEALEREQRDRLLRRTGKMQAIVGALIVVFILGLGYAGWSTRAYLKLRGEMLVELVWRKVLTPEEERALKPKQGFKECGSCPEMVFVPAGEFLMGSPANEKEPDSDEVPQHKVTIARAFAVSKYEVTFDEWDACVTLGGCAFPPGDQGWGRGTRPVINVSWNDAQRYVAWLSKRTGKPYRLLSEAEWEYAARAGSDQAYSWGDEIGEGKANCVGCGSRWDNEQTAPVGSFMPNAFGLYDMHGNVFEWVQDCYHENYNGAPNDGSAKTIGDCGYRVLRSGSFNDITGYLRSAYRFFTGFDSRSSLVGFRVAQTLTP
jgi:formylglycine-generating enzyme required for sulfatase activity